MLSVQLWYALCVSRLVSAQEGNRPWYFNQFSAGFVNGAVELRQAGMPEAEASSVAKHMVDDGMKPKQYTEMASMAMHWIESGNVPVTSLAEVASIFASAYTSMHTMSTYSSFVEYVKQHTSLYNLNALLARTPPANGGDVQSAIQHIMLSVYSSLEANHTGRAALDTITKVAGEYQHDIGLTLLPVPTNLDSVANFIYGLI